MIIVCFCHLQS